MNFEDTPEEAEFRTRCREWLEKNAKRRDSNSTANPFGASERPQI